MNDRLEDLIKHREINFCHLPQDPRLAGRAAAHLKEFQGVIEAEAASAHQVQVSYNLNHTCLLMLEVQLLELGFHLDNRLVIKIRRALQHYTEDTQIANLHCPDGEATCTQKVFVNRYRRLSHGCRDDRPTHWRKYL